MADRSFRVLAVIPARRGSKGLPGKNIRDLTGKPLIVWTIDAALANKADLSDIIVSTDSQDIADVAITAGAAVPFLRPASLATDDASSLAVLQHSVTEMERRHAVLYDWILLLQPTSPLRSAEDIRTVLSMARDAGEECESVISVTEKPGEHPRLAKTVADGRLIPFMGDTLEGVRRQDCTPGVVFNNGALYLTRRNTLMEKGQILGRTALAYCMPKERSVDIDDGIDFALAETLIQNGNG